MLSNPAPRTRALIENIQLFQEYHLKYPSHGYRWLNAKIRLDKGIEMSDPYAHKCCKAAGIKSKTKLQILLERYAYSEISGTSILI